MLENREWMLIQGPSDSIATDPRRSALDARRVSFAGKRRGLEFRGCIGGTGRHAMAVDVYENRGGKGRREASFSVFCLCPPPDSLQPLPQFLARASLRMQRRACTHITVHAPPPPLSHSLAQ